MTIRIGRPSLFMKQILSIGISASCFAILVATALAAVKPKSLILSPSELFQQATSGGVVTCGLINGKWQPGTLAKSGSFTSRKAELKAIKKGINTAPDETARVKLEKKRTKIQKKEKKEIPTCKLGPPPTPAPTQTAVPTPTQDPSQTPGPTPTPTPIPVGNGCYTEARDTTCFGIPPPLVGNETRGQQLFQSLGCSGCHMGGGAPNLPVSGNAIDYSEITTAFVTVTEMLPFFSSGEVSPQQVADLTAYLNRYNPNQ